MIQNLLCYSADYIFFLNPSDCSSLGQGKVHWKNYSSHKYARFLEERSAEEIREFPFEKNLTFPSKDIHFSYYLKWPSKWQISPNPNYIILTYFLTTVIHCSHVKNSEKVGVNSQSAYNLINSRGNILRKISVTTWCECCFVTEAGWFNEQKLKRDGGAQMFGFAPVWPLMPMGPSAGEGWKEPCATQ